MRSISLNSATDISKSTLSSNGMNSSQSTSDIPEEELIPPGLIKWRNAVENCRTAAQLAMCLNFLESHTAWDKSIMRAVFIFFLCLFYYYYCDDDNKYITLVFLCKSLEYD